MLLVKFHELIAKRFMMQQRLLNSEDREWLSTQKEAVRSSLEFTLSDLFYPS